MKPWLKTMYNSSVTMLWVQLTPGSESTFAIYKLFCLLKLVSLSNFFRVAETIHSDGMTSAQTRAPLRTTEINQACHFR